jgi:Dolichyl-phosphate-mannose-protein mannosyltransferase
MELEELNPQAQHATQPGTVFFRGFWETRVAPFLDKHFVLLCVCLLGIACARITCTYNALSLTIDEPTHFACGLEYLAKHVYRIETQHPPLSRMLQALGPYLAGARPSGNSVRNLEGLSAIARSGNADRIIFLMRLGNLPFFVLACLVVCGWSWHTFGRPVAVVATSLFTLLPTILADAGLATTDMALGATVGAAFFAIILWAESPTWWRSMLLGLFTALACLSKFTALGYIPLAACLALAFYLVRCWPGWLGLWRLAKQRLVPLASAGAIAALLIWAAYWFSVGTARLPFTNLSLSVPAPEFLDGIRSALNHNREGHPAFLLGEFRTTGWWYYFLVALAVKTPIAFLIPLGLGVYVCLRERARPIYLMPLAFTLGILLPSMRSHVDIGIRHIEPVYIGLSIMSALGLKQLLQWTRSGVISALTAGVLMTWMALSVAFHHPDYLAYFNGFAGKTPEKILVDSNYDWGQDLKLLGAHLRQLGVKEFSLASASVVGMSIPERHDYLENWYGLPIITDFNSCIPSPGWNVVSTTVEQSGSRWPGNRFYYRGPTKSKPWYEKVTPNERVGPLLIYFIPPGIKRSGENCH